MSKIAEMPIRAKYATRDAQGNVLKPVTGSDLYEVTENSDTIERDLGAGTNPKLLLKIKGQGLAELLDSNAGINITLGSGGEQVFIDVDPDTLASMFESSDGSISVQYNEESECVNFKMGNPSSIAGGGLTTDSAGKLKVNAGTALIIEDGELNVDVPSIAGNGLDDDSAGKLELKINVDEFDIVGGALSLHTSVSNVIYENTLVVDEIEVSALDVTNGYVDFQPGVTVNSLKPVVGTTDTGGILFWYNSGVIISPAQSVYPYGCTIGGDGDTEIPIPLNGQQVGDIVKVYYYECDPGRSPEFAV